MDSDGLDERATRARRVREIQRALFPDAPDDNVRFAAYLATVARDHGIPHATMSANRVAKLRSGSQLLQFEDVAVLEAADPKERGWLWIVFGEDATASQVREDDESRAIVRPASPASPTRAGAPTRGRASREAQGRSDSAAQETSSSHPSLPGRKRRRA